MRKLVLGQVGLLMMLGALLTVSNQANANKGTSPDGWSNYRNRPWLGRGWDRGPLFNQAVRHPKFAAVVTVKPVKQPVVVARPKGK